MVHTWFNKLIFLLLLQFSFRVSAQDIHGIIKDEKGETLPFSSILIKGTTQGVTANNRGQYQLNVQPGQYTIVCQHVGYSSQEKKVIVEDGRMVPSSGSSIELSFVLIPQKLILKEVIVKSNSTDPAYAIIRQAIKKRPYYNNQVSSFQCEAYIKGLIKLRNLPNRVMGKKVPESDRKEMGLDSSGKGIIFLSESITKVSVQKPKKIKLEVISGRQSGGSGFGFNFPTFISLYENNVNIFSGRLNPRGFISPIADGALNYYKYKYLGSFFEDGKEVNSIRVTPKRNYEPLFSGIINITDGDWRIHSCDLILTRTSQIEFLDTLQLTQIHVPISKDVWRVKNQLLHFNFKQFGIDAIGNFVNVYSSYNVDPRFPEKYFDRIIIKYDTSANKKTTAYWDTVRPVPLEPEEVKDYKIKDSLYQYRKDSANSQKNIDSLKKHQPSINIKNVLVSGIDHTHYSKTNQYSWHLEPLIKSVQYTSVEGVVANISADYRKYLTGWKTNLTLSPNIRYGFNNQRFYAWMDLNFKTRDWNIDKKLKRQTWNFAGGKRVSQFNKESNLSPFNNTIGTLFSGNNYMKIYENYFGEISFAKQFESGFRFSIDGLYEDRRPLENTTDFVISKKNEGKLTPNYPFEVLFSNFTPHKALIINVSLSIKPGQRYIQFPFNKVAIGSKYPTFTLNYSKGFQDVFGSNVNFDKWSFVVNEDVNLKLAGSIKYKAIIGGFLNSKSVFIQDYQHFNGNQSRIAKDYLNTFQLQSYYANSTTASFFSALFFEHHFNGLLTNKIPLFKKLNWHLLDGTNILYINSRTPYAELFAGMENIFKIFRIDLVAGIQDLYKPNYSVKIGAGGILGGRIKTSRVKGRSGL